MLVRNQHFYQSPAIDMSMDTPDHYYPEVLSDSLQLIFQLQLTVYPKIRLTLVEKLFS